ncbi:MAG TPA: S53 family peptidase [Acidimicrobiales bacterium]|nr:S53 family peptidase [Acidimicrobiales bacterium]
MRDRSHSSRLRARLGVCAAAGALVAFGAPALVAGASSANNSNIVYTVHPIAIKMSQAVGSNSFPSPYDCINQPIVPAPPTGQPQTVGLACYTPQIFHQAYQIPWTINGALAGTGTSVAIIDAFGSPTIQSDLATYDSKFHLPAANLNVYYPEGQPNFNGGAAKSGNAFGWAEETSLDVETVHALAPGATINLVVAPTNYGNALNNAVAYAVDNHLGDVLTMSYGSPEGAIAGGGNNIQFLQSNKIFQQAVNQGMSLFASSGDSGATGGLAQPNASYPASNPNVTAAGGTDLFVTGDTSPNGGGTYQSEYAWNDANPSTCPFNCNYGPFGATGGAPSVLFGQPSYQADLTPTPARYTSDVSFNASVYTATMIYLGFLGAANNGFYFFGGTSEASPSWAAITADLDQARGSDLGAMNPVLYNLASNPSTYAADFHDVTVGSNAFPFGAPGYSAAMNWDPPTGLGTPIVSGLMNSLAPHASLGFSAP